MSQNNFLIFPKEFHEYCKLNNFDKDQKYKLGQEIFERGFTIEKYGETPVGGKIKEKIIEKIVEVPVEKIVEKEIIKEISVKDNDLIKENEKLRDENKQLKDELKKITEQLEKFGQKRATFMKNSNLGSIYDE